MPPAPSSGPLVILDNNTIQSLLRRPDVLAAFPFFKAAAPKAQPKKPGGCGGCGRKKAGQTATAAAKNQVNLSDYNAIKAQLAALPKERQARFKQMIGAGQVRFRYVNQMGVRSPVTF